MQLEAIETETLQHTHIYRDTNFLSKALSRTAACICHNCACKPVRQKVLQ